MSFADRWIGKDVPADSRCSWLESFHASIRGRGRVACRQACLALAGLFLDVPDIISLWNVDGFSPPLTTNGGWALLAEQRRVTSRV